MRQRVEQDWNRDLGKSNSPGPITDGSKTSLDPLATAQPVILLNVGDTGQRESIADPNPANTQTVIEVINLEVEVDNPSKFLRLRGVGPE